MLSSNTIWRKGMTKKTRRRYTAEFKAAAVARLDETGETLSSVAQALGVAATQVKTWRLEQQAAGSAEAVARRKVEAAGFRQVSRQIRSGGTDQPWRALSSSGDGEHIAEGGDPLDMDRPSPGRGHRLLAPGCRSEEVAHLVM